MFLKKMPSAMPVEYLHLFIEGSSLLTQTNQNSSADISSYLKIMKNIELEKIKRKATVCLDIPHCFVQMRARRPLLARPSVRIKI